ncbi:unnamed protein product [Pedinophyceae sp. YPF-701]|nr:unnamed protein product [Pedinophyceae sp. YPF-701]
MHADPYLPADGGESPRAMRGHYMTETEKKLHDNVAGQAEQERITCAFKKTDFSGIRSLPNALKPGFRDAMREVVAKKVTTRREDLNRERSLMRAGDRHKNRLRRSVTQTVWKKENQDCGMRPAHAFATIPRFFSVYEYIPEGYGGSHADRMRDLERDIKRRERAKWIVDDDFVVRAPQGELPPSSAHANVLYGSYGLDKIQVGGVDPDAGEQPPMRSGARLSTKTKALGLAGEHLSRMAADFARETASFRDVSMDVHGLIVARFSRAALDEEEAAQDRAAEAREGRAGAHAELGKYMRWYLHNSRAGQELNLRKEVAVWGATVTAMDEVWYVFRGPWVTTRPQTREATLTRKSGRMDTGKSGVSVAGSADLNTSSLPTFRQPFVMPENFHLSRPSQVTFNTGLR